MKGRRIIWKFLKGLFKFIFKLFLILLWGTLRIVEVILQHLNNYLKKFIS